MTEAAPVRVRLLRTCKVDGEWRHRGSVLEVDTAEGGRLIRESKAVPAGPDRPLEDRRLDSAESWRAAGLEVRRRREREESR